jgi:O-antigen ligase
MKQRKHLPAISFILFSFIYFAASIVLLGNQYMPLKPEYIYTRYALLLFGFSSIIFIYLRKNGLKLYRFTSLLSSYLFFIWILFGLSIVVSEVIHNSIPVQGLFFIIMVPFVYFTAMPYLTKVSGSITHIALFAANITYLLISYGTVPLAILPYSGIAANTNGFGQMGAIAVISGIFTLLTLSRKRKIAKFFTFIAIIISFISVLISFSRTSLLVVVTAIFIIFAHYVITHRTMKPLIFLLIVGVIAWFTPVKQMFLSGVFEKFSTLQDEGNLLNGRTSIWQIVFKETTLFGHGKDYFNGFFEGAHNSIVYIIGVYGLFPAVLLVAFLLFLNVLSFLHMIKQKSNDKTAVFPFVIIVSFTLFSMTEEMFGLIGNGITIAFYHVVGLLLFREPKTKIITAELPGAEKIRNSKIS